MKAIIAITLLALVATIEAAKKPECSKYGDKLPDPDSCKSYYYCGIFGASKKFCPKGLYFDALKLKCREPKLAGCVTVKCPLQVSIEDNLLLANPDDCTTFFQCSYGVPMLQHCPDGLHFNAVKNYCDWPAEAKCIIQSFIEYNNLD